ncbi:hypothetical protein JQ615_34755 [Bradyrhizobium jicamae]|uniref:Uncharacterized protein n=1 Tax=Bradyrhizobium jicamae TaxID=280332 RepID=A0ABS5FUP5_9BRAD|nr:hypothetical protein [Bradyrhizobium jicamae]MBR0800537.1 hypothetical protein [Bradyrhizobium jicamae]MBR0938287.1 hypothetical protein [Bradyrhizobium jicamae]
MSKMWRSCGVEVITLPETAGGELTLASKDAMQKFESIVALGHEAQRTVRCQACGIDDRQQKSLP